MSKSRNILKILMKSYKCSSLFSEEMQQLYLQDFFMLDVDAKFLSESCNFIVLNITASIFVEFFEDCMDGFFRFFIIKLVFDFLSCLTFSNSDGQQKKKERMN